MSTPMNPQDPYGASDRPDGSDQSAGSTPPPPPMYGSGSTPPAYGSDAPSYGSNPPAYGGGAPSYDAGAYGQNPPAYGQYGGAPSPYGYSYPKNSLAIWSLVLGIVSFVLSCGIFTGIPAIIVGGRAKKAVAEGQANNPGMATAGVILGWIATVLTVLGIILFAVLLGNAEFREAFSDSSTTTF